MSRAVRLVLIPGAGVLLALAACTNPQGLSVTKATAVVHHVTPGRECPKSIQFRGQITATSRGKAVYRWERSDGTKEPRHTVQFAERGAAVVISTWTLRESYKGWSRLRVLEPRDLRSERASFSVDCRPTVLAATAAVSPTVSDRCNETFVFIGRIAVSGPATVTYRWERSDGTRSARATKRVSSAATTSVDHSWTIGRRAYSGWARLSVLGPGPRTSNSATFRKTLPCR